MKTCHRCSLSKNEMEFPVNKSRSDGRSETCLECKREYNRLHYRQNKAYYVTKAKMARDKLKELVKKLKIKCNRCSQEHIATLQFHHKDSSKKDFTISTAVGQGWSAKKVITEISKCEVLCANCHMIHHWEEQCLK